MKYIVFPLIMDDPYIKVAYIAFKGTYITYRWVDQMNYEHFNLGECSSVFLKTKACYKALHVIISFSEIRTSIVNNFFFYIYKAFLMYKVK